MNKRDKQEIEQQIAMLHLALTFNNLGCIIRLEQRVAFYSGLVSQTIARNVQNAIAWGAAASVPTPVRP